MITKSVSEARRQLGDLIQLARDGHEVVILKDSRPAVALMPIDDSDLQLATPITDRQAQKIWEMAADEPKVSFASATEAVRELKKRPKRTPASKKR